MNSFWKGNEMTQRLQNKIAVVTGIGAGIGRECALMFARHGATVIGCDINPQTAEATIAAAAEEGLTITSVHPVNLTDPAGVQHFIDTAGSKFGRIDVLLNAAAIAPPMAKLAEMDYPSQWTATMVGEVDIVFLACKAAWPYMLASGKASIINFASVSAFRASMALGLGAHCAGKAAVLALTRQLAQEGGPAIRANTIAPGMVVTAATAGDKHTADPAYKEKLLARIPMKRLGQPSDIAWAATFLASDESSWVTGSNFPIDGGVMAV
jgi:NAD(P)-dependent dehydrogenase (short-subunit alcohol dehydrogenase family)